MIALAATVLAASLAGSPHCVAMCGGFLCFACGQDATRSRLGAQLGYHGGRLASYVVLGTIAGALGGRVERFGFAGGAAVLAGSLMVLWGLAQLATALGAKLPTLGSPAPVRRALAAVVRTAAAWPPAVRALTVGAVSALLPCGWLWAFAATAAGTGAAWKGAVVMAVFWLGTVPALAGAGVLLQQALGPLQRRLPIVTASVIVIVGLLTVAGRFAAMPGGAAAGRCEHCEDAAKSAPSGAHARTAPGENRGGR